jgi:hypothetical protein
VQSGKTASGVCSAGPRFVRAVAPRIIINYEAPHCETSSILLLLHPSLAQIFSLEPRSQTPSVYAFKESGIIITTACNDSESSGLVIGHQATTRKPVTFLRALLRSQWCPRTLLSKRNLGTFFERVSYELAPQKCYKVTQLHYTRVWGNRRES